MRLTDRYETEANSAELALERFWLAALELKRVLDRNKAFDFSGTVRSSRVLLVGEGNLSFSLALAGKVGKMARNMTSTTLERGTEHSPVASENAKALRSRGVAVIGGVDATNLSQSFDRAKFDLIVFQFPNVGSRTPLYGRNPNHVLVRRFLRSATWHLSLGGKVAITAINSPHYDGAFDVDDAADRNDYDIPVAYPFYFEDYPGYTHVKTKDDATGVAGASSECVTYVFEPKRRTGQKGVWR